MNKDDLIDTAYVEFHNKAIQAGCTKPEFLKLLRAQIKAEIETAKYYGWYTPDLEDPNNPEDCEGGG